jgi:hypothetical protein
MQQFSRFRSEAASQQVALTEPDLQVRALVRDPFKLKRSAYLTFCSHDPSGRARGHAFPKPVPIPDRVEDMLFGIMR